jgi:hypothetical protein
MPVRRPPLLLLALLSLAACRGGELEDEGTIVGKTWPAADVAARAATQRAAVAGLDPGAQPAPKEILFGDLHVHTTFSVDAFMRTLPFMQGEGAHPPADACDFARYCSALDFWSITDHAEGLTTDHWKQTKDAVRQCNALAGDPKHPDLVTFLGWEWTQVGTTPDNHYGHKNVILRETADEKVPKRAISARDDQLLGAMVKPPPLWQRLSIPLHDWANRQRYFDFGALQEAAGAVPLCEAGVNTRELPENCHEIALEPRVLFEKLGQWGGDALVIPHGTTWGLYTPPGTRFDKQLTRAQNDPARQTLFEIFSGHGNSEEYREWEAVRTDANGALICPEPTDDYLPCCRRAGELIRARCDDPSSSECEARVTRAQQLYLEAGVAGHNTVPGATTEDWLDCGQCRDCFLPAMNYRPGNAAQYALAITNFDDPAKPARFRFGFLGSSDNHSARPGTGYKEYKRRMMTEAIGAKDESWRTRIMPGGGPKAPNPIPIDEVPPLPAFAYLEFERQASFFMTGGLVATHAAGRDRDAIWGALNRREVYGTSGDRILLWFDLLNGPDGTLPMGADTHLAAAPRFRVRAVGAQVQQPGCPEQALRGLGAERLELLCRGECFNPGDQRRVITHIDVIRIRPQVRPGEPLRPLIEDPWRRFECEKNQLGCVVEFEDPDFVTSGRENVYYVRAVQEPTPVVNGNALRCEYDDQGHCTRVRPCYGDYRTPLDDDCLAPAAERAWSSPIYLRPST